MRKELRQRRKAPPDSFYRERFAGPPGETLSQRYERLRITPSDIHQHLHTLRCLATGLQHVTEMGTRFGISATAFLMAQPRRLVCYDMVRDPLIEELVRLADLTEFEFKQENTLEAEIEPTELLFIDTTHTFEHVQAELNRHHGKSQRYLVFHDTETWGEQGFYRDDPDHPGATRDLGVGDYMPARGIMPAIEQFLEEHAEWQVLARYRNNNGLLVLERKPPA